MQEAIRCAGAGEKATTSWKAIELVRAMKDRGIREVIRSNSADLAFVIDATGSMAFHIDNMKKSIKNVVKKVEGTNSVLKLRLALVAFQDLCDGLNRWQVLDFVQTVDVLESFFQDLYAKGGCDTRKDVTLGIQHANGLIWTNPT